MKMIITKEYLDDEVINRDNEMNDYLINHLINRFVYINISNQQPTMRTNNASNTK